MKCFILFWSDSTIFLEDILVLFNGQEKCFNIVIWGIVSEIFTSSIFIPMNMFQFHPCTCTSSNFLSGKDFQILWYKKLTYFVKISLNVFTFHFYTAMVFVYDFHPGSETMMARHFHQANPMPNGYANPYNLDGAPRPYSAGKGRTRKYTLSQSIVKMEFAARDTVEYTCWECGNKLVSILCYQ